MFSYNEKTPHLQGLVTKRFGVSHLEILNPSKNGVFRSPTYQVKSFWKMLIPETNTSRIALSLDFVVGVSQPHELKTMSPWGEISAILLPWSLTLVNPSESTSTLVFDFDQSVRVAIAACICRSILRIGEFGWLPLYYTHTPTPSGELVTNWNNPQKKSAGPFGQKKGLVRVRWENRACDPSILGMSRWTNQGQPAAGVFGQTLGFPFQNILCLRVQNRIRWLRSFCEMDFVICIVDLIPEIWEFIWPFYEV